MDLTLVKIVPWSLGDATSIDGALMVFASLMSCLEPPFTPTYIHTKCITSQRHMIKSYKILGFPKELEMHMQPTSISLIIHYLWQYLPRHSNAIHLGCFHISFIFSLDSCFMLLESSNNYKQYEFLLCKWKTLHDPPPT